MPYRFLEEVSIADVAFEATGKTLEELFKSAALAVTATMVTDAEGIERKIDREFKLEAESLDMLLFHLLQEVIFLKDAEQLLLSGFDVDLAQKGNIWTLIATAYGEIIDPERHELIVDVKAVSLHNYTVKETKEGWIAQVILDV